MTEHLARRAENQPDLEHATADEIEAAIEAKVAAEYLARRADPLARPGDGGDLVPGYLESPDGHADAADQARADRRTR
jgi:hypothetical protein